MAAAEGEEMERGRRAWHLWRRTVAGLVMLGLCAAMPWSAAAAKKHHKEAPPPCPAGDHGCQTDQQIQKVGDAVSDIAAQGQEARFWDISQDLQLGLHSKHPVVRTIFLAPTYVTRAVTWPFALLGDLLIRKGVVDAMVDVLSNKDRTFWVFPRFELGFDSGFGGGVGMLHTDLFHGGYRFDAGYLNHINLNQSGWASLEQLDAFSIAGRPVGYRMVFSVLHDKNARFYGTGAEAASSDESEYQIDNGTVGGWLGYEPIDHFWIRLHSFFTGDSIRPGADSPSVEQVFPTSMLPGFNTETLYADVGISLSHDTREAGAAPEHGGLQRFTFDRFQALGAGDRDFNQYGFEVLHHFRLWLPRNVLILRTAWVFQQESGDNQIPFNRLATVDTNSPERGLGTGRFRDLGSMLFNIEYRYPVWRYIDGSFFFDTGRVFHGITDVSFKHLAYAGGVGLRVHTKDYFLFRFEAAFGNEGSRVLFKTSTAF
jgi:hypothetical protein